MKIMLLTRSMAVGGAQRQLCVLCRELMRDGHDVSVLVYYSGDPLHADLTKLGVPVIDLRKQGRWRNFAFLWRLVRTVRHAKPDVIYAHLPAPNLLALMLKYLGCGAAIVCGVRASGMNVARTEWLTRLTLWLERRLVPRADLVIANSRVGAHYISRGTAPTIVDVIENGIDTQAFAFDTEGRHRMRADWGATETTAVIGCVARLDPMKDHTTLLHAFSLLLRALPGARLVCVGTFAEPYHSRLLALAGQLLPADSVKWIEREPRLSDVYSGLDALCLTSAYGEGFPNVVAEAMACGVPCVATDVGDTARILSSADFLVPVGDREAIARALLAALKQGRTFSQLRREKIETQFSPRRLAERTEAALTKALLRRNARMAYGDCT